MAWRPTAPSSALGVAVYSFSARNERELSIDVGEEVRIIEESTCGGWYRGFIYGPAPRRVGIFPSTYVHRTPCVTVNRGKKSITVQKEDAIALEVASVLREWMTQWKELYVNLGGPVMLALRATMVQLIKWRRDILLGSLRSDQLLPIKSKIASKIDWGNKELNLFPVIRNEQHDEVDVKNTSVVDLYQMCVNHTMKQSNAGGMTEPSTSTQLNHIYCEIEEISCLVQGEDTDLLFSLYDSKRQIYLSERFLMRCNKSGNPVSMASTGVVERQCVFTDLDKEDIANLQDCYLVCHVVRCGRMDLNSKKSNGMFRRPSGCAAIPLQSLKTLNASDSTLRHVTAHCFPFAEEKDFSSLHEQVIKKLVKTTDRSGTISAAMRTMQGDLSTLREQYVNLIDRNTCLVRKLGIAEIVKPGEFRNDFFLTIEKGDFEKSSKSPPNVEILVQVVKSDGKILKAICAAANQDPIDEFRCFIIYHCANPRWHETIRLAIPVNVINDVQVRFTIHHCSSSGSCTDQKVVHLKPVLQNGTTIQDGTYTLSIDSTREALVCSTRVCSTKLTQDINLLGLLRWRLLKKPELVYALKNVLLVNGKDICLFMQDIFDALFSILDQEDDMCGQLAFNAIVRIINLFLDSQYAQYRESLDVYINMHFSGALVYKKIINNIRGYLDHGSDPEVTSTLLYVLYSLEYLLKFVVQSRCLFARSTHTIGFSSFKENIRLTILSIASFLTNPSPTLRLTQKVALKQLGVVCQQLLLNVCEPADLGHVIIDVVRAVPASSLNHPLLLPKLRFMKSIVQSKLFEVSNCNTQLLQKFLTDASVYLQRLEEPSAVLDLISALAGKLEAVHSQESKGMKMVVRILFTDLVQFIVSSNAAGSHQSLMTVACCSLLSFMRSARADDFQEIINPSAESLQLVEQLCTTFSSLISDSMDCKAWHTLSILQADIIAVTFANIAEKVFIAFSGSSQFETRATELLLSLFELGGSLITHNLLQLDTLSPGRRLIIEQRCGDIRVSVAETMVKMWHALGANQNSYAFAIPSVIVRSSLVREESVQRLLLPLYVDLLIHAYNSCEDGLSDFYDDMTASLHSMITNGSGDDTFVTGLEDVWEAGIRNASLDAKGKEQCLDVVKRIRTLTSLLIDYRGIRAGVVDTSSPAGLSLHINIVYNLMCFYKTTDQLEMSASCLLMLIELNVAAENWTEAGFAYLTCADTLDFGDKQAVPSVLTFPHQSSEERKAALLMESITALGKGNLWEKGIEVCEMYSRFLKQNSYDFQRVSEVLRTEASYFESIVSIHRPSREYFRVGYYGRGFWPFLRNKVYVYRGREYEKLGAFSERILQGYPGAELMKTNQPPGDDTMQSDKRYLQICTVKPVACENPVADHDNVNPYIAEFYLTNRVSQFVYSRPFHKGVKDKENEFKSLWLERTTVDTVNELPNILPWAEVINTTVRDISPIENGVETMLAKNKELIGLIQSHKNPGKNINPLSMALNGVIDAAVMGGVDNYEKAFFTQVYLEENPEDKPLVDELKKLIVQQVSILEDGLQVHQAQAPENLLPFHEKMAGLFIQMKKKSDSIQQVYQSV
ncbi:dedicator of cytokinesis protein 2-like [Sycon ciliatum]|uniref:dedicator of cytokinesis protein 2-like n=1 Tax=Sycon ciliatum TaxID=27933 RepID=UPI0031F69A8E